MRGQVKIPYGALDVGATAIDPEVQTLVNAAASDEIAINSIIYSIISSAFKTAQPLNDALNEPGIHLVELH